MEPTTKKEKKVYLLVKVTLAAITNPEIYNRSDNSSSFLPHIKSKIDFLMNRWLFSKHGFKSLCSFHLVVPPPPSICNLLQHQAGSKGKSMENGRSYGADLEVGHIPSNHVPLARTQLLHQYCKGRCKM